MRDALYESLFRYEAMTGICDWESEDEPGREDRDRIAYGKELGLVPYPDGNEYLSYARMVRFLVEVCGHAYGESLDAVVEHVQSQPVGGYRSDLDAEREAATIRAGSENIIEALFHLKVTRLIAGGNDRALDYNWKVTRALMAKDNSPPLRAPAG